MNLFKKDDFNYLGYSGGQCETDIANKIFNDYLETRPVAYYTQTIFRSMINLDTQIQPYHTHMARVLIGQPIEKPTSELHLTVQQIDEIVSLAKKLSSENMK